MINTYTTTSTFHVNILLSLGHYVKLMVSLMSVLTGGWNVSNSIQWDPVQHHFSQLSDILSTEMNIINFAKMFFFFSSSTLSIRYILVRDYSYKWMTVGVKWDQEHSVLSTMKKTKQKQYNSGIFMHFDSLEILRHRLFNRLEWAPDCIVLPSLHLSEGWDFTGHRPARPQEQCSQCWCWSHLWQVTHRCIQYMDKNSCWILLWHALPL